MEEENQSVIIARRDTGAKDKVSWSDLNEHVPSLLDTIQKEMLEKARAERDERIVNADNWTDFMTELNKGQLVLAPWCEEVKCEEDVNEKSKQESLAAQNEGEEILTGAAKTLCLPLEQEPLAEDAKCFNCGSACKKRALWGRSY